MSLRGALCLRFLPLLVPAACLDGAPYSSAAAPHSTTAACPESPYRWDEVLVSKRVSGADVLVKGSDDDRAAIADQASRDLACPASSVTVARPNASFAWSVEACGHHAAYRPASRSVDTRELRGHVGLCVHLDVERFVRLDDDPVPSLGRLDAEWSVPGGAAGEHESRFIDGAGELRRWTWLVAAAARDLSCPRDEVVPGFVSVYRSSPIPVAEGCGQRATYLPASEPPFLTQSIVRITR